MYLFIYTRNSTMSTNNRMAKKQEEMFSFRWGKRTQSGRDWKPIHIQDSGPRWELTIEVKCRKRNHRAKCDLQTRKKHTCWRNLRHTGWLLLKISHYEFPIHAIFALSCVKHRIVLRSQPVNRPTMEELDTKASHATHSVDGKQIVVR